MPHHNSSAYHINIPVLHVSPGGITGRTKLYRVKKGKVRHSSRYVNIIMIVKSLNFVIATESRGLVSHNWSVFNVENSFGVAKHKWTELDIQFHKEMVLW